MTVDREQARRLITNARRIPEARGNGLVIALADELESILAELEQAEREAHRLTEIATDLEERVEQAERERDEARDEAREKL